tara:strand:+ start:17249 stop:17842 length:594 start_codon:yes stop_codon:yes gene_type:complete
MADIKQTIKDFYKVAQTRDFARDFQFRVLDVSNKGVPVFTEDDLVYATAATLPGKTIATKEVPYNGFTFRIPGTVSYTDSDSFTIDFYCDATTQTRIAMENWITETFNDETSVGDGLLHDNSTITLVQLDTKLEPIRTYKLRGVFPTDCGNISYSMSGDGEVATVTITLAYQFFRRDNELNAAVNAIGKLAGAAIGG